MVRGVDQLKLRERGANEAQRLDKTEAVGIEVIGPSEDRSNQQHLGGQAHRLAEFWRKHHE